MNPSVVAIIKGGLGNQLFGYAAARAYALRTGRELLIDDASGFTRDGYGRTFRLKRFPISAKPAPADIRLGDPKQFRHKWTRSLNKLLPSPFKNYLAEQTDRRVEQITRFNSKRNIVYLNGYWQEEACFESAASIIREELTPPPFENEESRKLEQDIRSRNSVFVHARRIRYSPRLKPDYYQTCVSLSANELELPTFEVFSDDIQWARENLDFHNHSVRFHEGSSDELTDFRLMTSCRHAIIANSSFSWWAAWLQNPEGQRVWCPKDTGWPVKSASQWTEVPNNLERD